MANGTHSVTSNPIRISFAYSEPKQAKPTETETISEHKKETEGAGGLPEGFANGKGITFSVMIKSDNGCLNVGPELCCDYLDYLN